MLKENNMGETFESWKIKLGLAEGIKLGLAEGL